ncbi:MAG: sugar ABC transporter permease [Lachnospiraceae bacterium]|nr:sugar ABC transporter permease [Lachnospiraceae bacterium]
MTSFYKWNGGNVREFIGLKNYIDLFQDKQFWIALFNCVKICVANLVIALTMPLLAAELLYAFRSKKAQYYLRTLMTFPMVVPGVVVILLWKWILSGDTGVLNTVLTNIGLENLVTPWLGSSKTALFSIILIGFPWVSGLNFLLYYGALQAIPGELLEAAKIDGANIFQRFFRIDLPMLASQTKLIITLCLINSLQVFETIFILTKGGPGTSTMVPSIMLYESAFSFKKYGYSSAIGVVMFVIILIVSAFNQKFLKNTETMD